MSDLEPISQQSVIAKLASQVPEIRAVWDDLRPNVRQKLESLELAEAQSLLETVVSDLTHLRSNAADFLENHSPDTSTGRTMTHEERVKNQLNYLLNQGIKLLQVEGRSSEVVNGAVSIAIRYRSDPARVVQVYDQVSRYSQYSSDSNQIWTLTEQLFQLHRDFKHLEAEALREHRLKPDKGEPLTLELVQEVFDLKHGSIDDTANFLEEVWETWIGKVTLRANKPQNLAASRSPLVTFGLQVWTAVRESQG